MNELRWILLGIGVLVIAGIYFLGVIKQKRNIRSRVEKYPGFNHDSISSVTISPKKEKHIDISGALTAFNSYLRQARAVARSEDKKPASSRIAPEIEEHDLEIDEQGQISRENNSEQKIMVIYIRAHSSPRFYGTDILSALKAVDMQYGEMRIFHYHGPDKKHAQRALFSLANIHEPGTFDIDKMDSFVTDGLAMFMCLPAEIGGDIAFEIMLDTAQNIARQLGAELQGADHQLLDVDGLNRMREIASRY